MLDRSCLINSLLRKYVTTPSILCLLILAFSNAHSGATPSTDVRLQNDHDLATVPHWSDTFQYQGLTYEYNMVGTDPRRGSATTVIPTVLIPIRFVFENGQILDASTDLYDGRTPIDGIINSPIFQPFNFQVGGVSVGNTQYGDAFQRANFWNSVSHGSPEYHVLLGQPTVKPVFEVFVPNDIVVFDGGGFTILDADFLKQATTDALLQANLSPLSLAIVVWGSVFPNFSGQRIVGYHGAYDVPGGVQTYIATPYRRQGVDPPAFDGGDVDALSMLLLNWLNNPFDLNYTPGWGLSLFDARCNSTRFEVADRLKAGYVHWLFGTYPVQMGQFTYHLADGAFIDHFTRGQPSRSAGGKYNFFRNPDDGPSGPCTGHVEVNFEQLEFPEAILTIARGINNRGAIVGSFRDALNRRHGFIYDGRRFTQLDYPGARSTAANGINDSEDIVGEFTDSAGLPHGFLYSHGSFTQIDFPGSADGTSIVRGMNNRGDLVGLYDATELITHGFAYEDGQFRTLDSPFFLQSDVTAINDRDEIVGYSYDDPFASCFGPEPCMAGFLRDSDGFARWDFPSSMRTITFTINNLGMHGGTFYDPWFGQANGYVTIYGFPYEVYGDVFGMNDKRQIVGSRIDTTSGRRVGFVATLPK